MTNYEWIKAGGIDRMMWFDASGCECCVRCNDVRGRNDTMCTNGRSAWLEASIAAASAKIQQEVDSGL